jgi:hypothetical protein
MRRFLLAALAALPLSVGPLPAQTSSARVADQAYTAVESRPARSVFEIVRTDADIRIDATLDEPAWTHAVQVPLPYETWPGDNAPAPVSTTCWLTYDDEHLYFGCVAADPRPDALRAFITDRDDILGHDRVGIAFDPFNDARRSFEFSVSALGVQRDARFDEQQGWDDSWDAIWHSSGRITDSGYVVEAAIPFRSLRFPAGDAVQTWGFFALREWPRSQSVEIQSMAWDRGNSCRLCQANLLTGIAGLSPGVNLELNPTFTSSRTDRQAEFPAGDLQTGSVAADPGLDVRWGITPNLTLNGTVNPDFSQVEADVAQLDVNNRFALFFPEKRPFFLEGGDFFSTPVQAVFTRTIADPIAGTKLTGKLGAHALGTMVALDDVNNLLLPGNQGSSTTTLDQRVLTAVARIRRDVGASGTVGLLYTGREGEDYHNRVAGIDMFLRPLAVLTVRAQYLRSDTRYPHAVAAERDQPERRFGGDGAQLRFDYNTRNWFGTVFGQVKNGGFRADAGFVQQVDVRSIDVWAGRRFWGGSGDFFTQLGIEGGGWNFENVGGRLTNQGLWLNGWFDGPAQTSFWLNPNMKREFFAGQVHELVQLWSGFAIRPTGTLLFEISGNVGDAIDFVNARKAFRVEANPLVQLRLGRHIDLQLRHTVSRLSVNEGEIFTANISQLRAVYNFNPRTFVRVVTQFRDTDRNPTLHEAPVSVERRSLFSQLLFSYKVNPQTALFLGYADDRLGLTDEQLDRTALTQTGRSFFLKVGYAWRP